MLNAKATRTAKKQTNKQTQYLKQTNKQKQKAVGLKVMLHGTICNDDF